MRNFNPLLITDYIDEYNYATIGSISSCLGFARVQPEIPTSLFTTINDFSLEDPEPSVFAGCRPKTATFLPHGSHMGTQRVAIGNKLIARDYSWRFGSTEYDQFQRWIIAQAMPAAGTPEIDNLYAPTILDKWKYQYSGYSCNALLDAFDEDHPALLGSFWHPSDHKSWIDFVKCDFSSTDVWRENIIRCCEYDPMSVPRYGVSWSAYFENYRLEVRALPGLTGTEYAKCVQQTSGYDDFRDGSSHEDSQSFIPYGDPYQYHVTVWWRFESRGSYRYHRWKTQVWDNIDGVPTLIRESSWSSTLSLSHIYYNLENAQVLDETSQYIPYYAYLTSLGKTGGASCWLVHIQTYDENIINYRFQTSTDSSFATTDTNVLVTAVFAGNQEGVDWDNYPTLAHATYFAYLYNIPSGEGPFDDYYCRVRGENADGSVVSEWSEVFTLTYTPHTGYTTSSDIGITEIYVEETHDESVAANAVEYEFIVDGETTIAAIGEDTDLYLYALKSDGSGFTKELVPKVHSGYEYFSQTLSNFVRFGGKVYALYDEHWYDSEDFYAHYWVEITDGVFGALHEITYPSSGYKYPAWTFLTNLYGHLQLCSSLSDNELLFGYWWGISYPEDNDNKFRLGTMAILESETEFTVHDDIITGRYYSTDPWNGSFWYEYDGRFEETNLGYRIAWLQGEVEPPRFFPWIFKVQLRNGGPT